MDILNLDLETFSTEDIKNGSFKYSEGMIILLLGYSFNFEPVEVIDFTIWQEQGKTPAEIWLLLPARLRNAFLDPSVLKQSANVNFERVQLGKYFNIYIPPEQCRCTLVHAGMAGYPMKLETCAKALELDQLKQSIGKALIRIFCIPDKEGNRIVPSEFPEKWQQFIGYCAQDIVTEQAIAKAIDWYKITPLEHEIWCMVERKNERGVKIDMELVDSCIYLNTIYRQQLLKQAVELTGLSNPNSRNQLKKWLEEELDEENIKSLDKNAVSKMIREVDNEKAIKVLNIRKQISKSSITKYAAMKRNAGKDHRIRGMFQYWGAQKSSRESGRLSQPQNYPRVEDWFVGMLEDTREIVRRRDIESLDLVFDNVPAILSQLLRTAFIADTGKELAVLDYKSVEVVILAYLADETWQIEFFKKGGDLYIETAMKMYKITRDQVTKDIRQKSKISSLLCQYGGTKRAMIKNNDTIENPKKRVPNKEMNGIVKAWRETNKNIVAFWWEIGRAAVETVRTRVPHDVRKGISFYMIGPHLQMKMPSGKSISYANAFLKTYWMGAVKQKAEGEFDEKGEQVYEIVRVKAGEVITGEISEFNSYMRDKRWKQVENIQPKQMESLCYWGMDKVWGIIETYGPKLAQNATESWGRDLLMYSSLNFEKNGIPVNLTVHDEICSEIDEGSWEYEDLKELMIQKPKWSEKMHLNADGFIGSFYKK